MLKGLGCDLVEVARVEDAMKKEGFAQRVFTEQEQLYIQKKGVQTAAGYWAAKEAVSKALGTGFSGFTMQDIEILTDETGAPQAFLTRGAQARLARLGALTPAEEGAPLPVRCTAGMYLCNTMTYRLAELSARTGLRAGFMHVPTQPAYAAARRLREMEAAGEAERKALLDEPLPPSMALELMIAGTRAAIGACLEES